MGYLYIQVTVILGYSRGGIHLRGMLVCLVVTVKHEDQWCKDFVHTLKVRVLNSSLF